MWKGNLAGIRELDKGLIMLHIRVYSKEHSSGVGFFCKIDPKKYRGIGLLRKDHEITVEGEIESVDDFGFDIKADKITY
jgi:hypothetical protein